jgi:hypothetical protein
VAVGVFIKFYGVDPLDFTWGRFHSLLSLIGAVEDCLRPKSALELALIAREEAIKKYKREHPDEF